MCRLEREKILEKMDVVKKDTAIGDRNEKRVKSLFYVLSEKYRY